MRELLGNLSQNKNFLMFITSIIYILGLFAYFNNQAAIFCVCVSILAIFGIIKNYFPLKIILLWLFMFYLGFFNASLRIKNSDELFTLAPQKSEITGQIISIPNIAKSNTLKFFFKVDKIKYDGKIISVPENKTLVSLNYKDGIQNKPLIGNYYSIKGKLVKPFESTNPSQFSYGSYLRNFQTYTVFYANENDYHLIPAQLSLKWKLIQGLNNSRIGILESHAKYLKSPNLEILGGIVFGDDAIAPPDYIKTTFINSGLLHILAASGMNVAFIYGFLYFFLRKLHVPYKLSVLSGILVVILYSLMTGLGPSVIRAAIMLIFILVGKLIDRDAHSISLLAFVALLMLVYNPAFINDVGFQLSFIVTFGLLLSTTPVMEYFKSLPAWISGSIFVPVIAQVWVIPIQMFYFNNISLYSVFANILTVPFLSVISFGGFVSSVFALFKPIADFVCQIFDFVLNPMLNILVWISNTFANLPHSLIITTHPSVFQIILYYFILMFSVYILKNRFSNKNIIKITLLLILILSLSTINISNHNLEILAFDVQNGDAFLLKTPQNKYIIIDTGKSGYRGGASKAKMIILKYLRDRGIKHIDSMIITHFDSDHAGGAVDLIENLKVDKVYVNSISDNSKLAQRIYKSAGNKIITVDKKTKIIEEPEFSVELNRAQFPQADDYDNENSIISVVKYNKFCMLFAGDAGVETFNKIKNDIPSDITVLKVGHHGARGVVNPEMINYLNPKISLISVGQNIYGHPNTVTLKYLQKSKVYRTDRDHAVKIIVNKENYKILTYDSIVHKFKFNNSYK